MFWKVISAALGIWKNLPEKRKQEIINAVTGAAKDIFRKYYKFCRG